MRLHRPTLRTGAGLLLAGALAVGGPGVVPAPTTTGATASAAVRASSVERGLAPNAVAVHRAAKARFPEITTYYGLRAGANSDHSSGHALDLMIPHYKSASGRALGFEVARWARAHHRALGIHYVIWDQHIWNIQRDAEGWRKMADRGGDSANHKNHVHISVY